MLLDQINQTMARPGEDRHAHGLGVLSAQQRHQLPRSRTQGGMSKPTHSRVLGIEDLAPLWNGGMGHGSGPDAGGLVEAEGAAEARAGAELRRPFVGLLGLEDRVHADLSRDSDIVQRSAVLSDQFCRALFVLFLHD